MTRFGIVTGLRAGRLVGTEEFDFLSSVLNTLNVIRSLVITVSRSILDSSFVFQ